MKIVIAMDSFKGSLSSREAGMAAAKGIAEAAPDAEISVIPVADGGEGTLRALVDALGGEIMTTHVDNPMGTPVEALYGIHDDTAIIEVAAACGLTLVPESERNPLAATSYGVGQLIRDALYRGCRSFMVGLGGSATNDAGIGMLRALGWRFYDSDGSEVGHHAEEASRIVRIEDADVLPELATCRFTVACDVTNPLTGSLGASHVFGSQKGATPQMVVTLDKALLRFSHTAALHLGNDRSSSPGAGAAGGLGFAFTAFLNSELKRGIDMVLDAVGFDRQIEDASYVFTGEGRLDDQTLMGKTPSGILRRCRDTGIPVIAIGGSVTPGATQSFAEAGFSAVFPIPSSPLSLEDAMRPGTAAANITRTVSQIMRLLTLTQPSPTSSSIPCSEASWAGTGSGSPSFSSEYGVSRSPLGSVTSTGESDYKSLRVGSLRVTGAHRGSCDVVDPPAGDVEASS